MHADSCFFIGSTHEVCEDYALSGVSSAGRAYAVVSDGCSGSEHTDFGARFLCHAAARQFDESGEFNPDRVIWEAAGMARQAALSQTCLDATMLFASDVGSGVSVHMYGDGMVIGVRHDGSVDVDRIEFKHGAPAYLSYRVDFRRMDAYVRKTEYGFRALRSVTLDPGCESVRRSSVTTARSDMHDVDPFVFLAREEFRLVILVSDGAESFQRKENGAPKAVPPNDVVVQLTKIKGFSGQFMRRRVRKFLHAFCREQGWQHADDLAVAAIDMGERKG